MSDHATGWDNPGEGMPSAGSNDTSRRLAKLRAAGSKRTGNDLNDTIHRLLDAHPDIRVDFRTTEFSEMEDDAKRHLLSQIRTLLDINPR
ncbi:hypothetical protein TA3x_003825 [Tundrisphaera sp. TA3]|uniref:hypothetical protein n=1 Tax=Tundrisphaera sp. TA3 TaxID=3435775 RepID=UPI003EBDDB3B